MVLSQLKVPFITLFVATFGFLGSIVMEYMIPLSAIRLELKNSTVHTMAENTTLNLSIASSFGDVNHSLVATYLESKTPSQRDTHSDVATIVLPIDNSSNVKPTEIETLADTKTPECCLMTSVDIYNKFTPEFFETQRTNGLDPQTKWSGKEYEEWVQIWSKLNPNHENQTNLNCETQYKLLVLDQVHGFYLRNVLTGLGQGKFRFLPYYDEKPNLPRILLLGDSITRGIRIQTQDLFHSKANIVGAPTNCLGFEKYRSGLPDWLGSCPWDLVQFNVGMHFHPNVTSWEGEYLEGVREIVTTIREHSPSAQIVFALTTPSPFDSAATTPKRESCPHFNKFHKKGFVSTMNKVVMSSAKELGVIINDRYSVIQPVLATYQKKCDVHYSDGGYRFIANNDWRLFSSILKIRDDRVK